MDAREAEELVFGPAEDLVAGTTPSLASTRLGIWRDCGDRVLTLRLSGEFDMSGIRAFESEMERARASNLSVVVVDLSALAFLDVAAAGSMVTASRRFSGGDPVLQFIPPQSRAGRRVLDLFESELGLQLV